MKHLSHNAAQVRPGRAEIHSLTAGTLSLTIDKAGREGLFRLAERQNPKRAFLFVSTILGRHIPVSPKAHRQALRSLADKAIPHLLEGPVFVMGYAETAVGIGAGIFDCLHDSLPDQEIGYLHTTRHPLHDETPWFTIEEGHSHATDHFIMHPRPGVCHSGPGATLVLVDDETTTGTTFARLAEELTLEGALFDRIVLVTLTDWSDGKAEDIVSRAAGGVAVRSVSLMRGCWTWTPDPEAALPVLPTAVTPECPPWQPDPKAAWRSPRDGLRGNDLAAIRQRVRTLDLPRPDSPGRVLVIGTGEHVWQPFLVAEALEADGHETGFIATTRSPILPGPVIEHKIAFPDHFGIGLPMFLHNVDPDAWGRIILFTETGIEGVHADLRRALGKGYVVDGNGQIHDMKTGISV